MIQNAAGQVDAVDDIAPLIRPTHLQRTAITAVQFKKVIGLKDHVIEFKEAQALFAIQTRLDRFKRQHAIDRKMPPNIAQKFQIIQPVQPFGIVQHQRACRAVIIAEITCENAAHARDIVINRRRIQKRAFIRSEGGITNLCGAAAHQCDRLMPRFLIPTQQHNVQQMTHMQGFCCCIISDIGRGHARAQLFV